jgi:hypothetical protein
MRDGGFRSDRKAFMPHDSPSPLTEASYVKSEPAVIEESLTDPLQGTAGCVHQDRGALLAERRGGREEAKRLSERTGLFFLFGQRQLMGWLVE